MATFTELNLLECSPCQLEVSDTHLNPVEPVKCVHCGKKIAVYVFPALVRADVDRPVTVPVVASESSCFYHAEKRAAVVCEECGRFLCALCDVEYEGRHVCAPCVERAEGDAPTTKAGTRYYYYDTLALIYAVIGVLTVFPAIVLGPLAIYTVIRHWKSPRSILPRSKWRFVLAAVLGVAQIAYWIFFVFLLVEAG